MEDITKEQEAINLGSWLIEFGEHVKSHPELLVEYAIEYQPIGDTLLNSPTSYENACKIMLSLVKKAG